MSKIVDYSVGRPAPSAIVQAGYVGVMRYVAPLPMDAAKVVTAAEYQALRAAGLKVGLNWEWYANRAREGATAGLADALEAKKQADALGYTGAIYFSVDYDAPATDQPELNAYFQACAQVLGLARLGAYAGYWPLKRLFDAGLITYGWQTIAWSGSMRESRAHLLQDTFGLFAGDADGNEVLKVTWQGEMTMDPAYVFVDNSQPGGLYKANGFAFYGWIAQNIEALISDDKLSVVIGLPQEGQHHDADGRWRQRFTYAVASQSDSNQSDFRFEPLPAPAAPPPPPAPTPQPSKADLALAALKAAWDSLP